MVSIFSGQVVRKYFFDLTDVHKIQEAKIHVKKFINPFLLHLFLLFVLVHEDKFYNWQQDCMIFYSCLFQILAFFCIVCCAPAYSDSQHWFLTVVVISFLGTIFFSIYYLCLAEPLNKLQINWLMVVSIYLHIWKYFLSQKIFVQFRSSGSLLPPPSSTSPRLLRSCQPLLTTKMRSTSTGLTLRSPPGSVVELSTNIREVSQGNFANSSRLTVLEDSWQYSPIHNIIFMES